MLRHICDKKNFASVVEKEKKVFPRCSLFFFFWILTTFETKNVSFKVTKLEKKASGEEEEDKFFFFLTGKTVSAAEWLLCD